MVSWRKTPIPDAPVSQRVFFAVTRTGVPADYSGFTSKEKKSRLLYIKSQYDHMGIVTSQAVIPIVLRLTPLRLLP
jgi:hypothetical protein